MNYVWLYSEDTSVVVTKVKLLLCKNHNEYLKNHF